MSLFLLVGLERNGRKLLDVNTTLWYKRARLPQTDRRTLLPQDLKATGKRMLGVTLLCQLILFIIIDSVGEIKPVNKPARTC
jgi:hypothetical protein